MATINSPFVGRIGRGIDVLEIDTRHDQYSKTIEVTLRLMVSPDSVQDVMPALANLLDNKRWSPTSPAPVPYNFVRAADEISERSPTEPPMPNTVPTTTLVELQEHLDARLDEIDQALRLLVDP